MSPNLAFSNGGLTLWEYMGIYGNIWEYMGIYGNISGHKSFIHILIIENGTCRLQNWTHHLEMGR